MLDKMSIEQMFLESSKRRLDLIKESLSNIPRETLGRVDNKILNRYLTEVEKREHKIFLDHSLQTNTKDRDISDLEGDVSLFVNDIVLNAKDSDGIFLSLKDIFSRTGYSFVFYPSVELESRKFSIFDNIFFVGVPINIINERLLFPLVLHEIGHSLVSPDLFKSVREKIENEAARLKQSAIYGANINIVNTKLLNRSNLYQRISKSWVTELASDMFGAFMVGLPYLTAFLLNQLNKRYLSDIDDHPSNKLRFLFLVRYLERTGEIKNSSSMNGLVDLVNTDDKLDSKKWLFGDISLQKLFIEEFNYNIGNKGLFLEAQKEVKKIFNKCY
jgi:hypothetical protein